MDTSFDITRFGALGDGAHLNTQAIQSAVDEAARTGGTVYVPAGTFLTGTVELKSGVTLELHPSAKLLGSPRIADYRQVSETEDADRRPWHLLMARDASAVTVRGGTIDGNGPAFWEPTVGDDPLTVVPAREPDPARAALTWIRANKAERPSPMIDFSHCRDVRIVDTRITNGAGWNLHMHCCDRVWIRGVDLDANLLGPNNDGFDITGCRDVMISDCHLSCCDDAIVLKTTKDSRSVERVTVTNCVLRTRCAALKLGANESFHDFRQITFSNCVVFESNRAVGLYSFDGAVIEDLTISNIVCDTRAPFLFNRPIHLDVRRKGPGTRHGAIRNVLISQIVARTDGRILMTSEEPNGLDNIVLRDIRIVCPVLDDPSPGGDPAVGGAQFSNCSLDARAAMAAVVAENARGLVLENVSVRWPDGSDTEGWNPPLKAANGTTRLFTREEFTASGAPQFHFLWARGLSGGYGRCPAATTSSPEVPLYVLDNCEDWAWLE
ncbi:MAG: hypothetical protein JJU00_08300 [Opitutales bacterium]|nr:hypothetical protein [Opitutales bacterium]